MDLCIHHNDADGRCAAAIVKLKYPDVKFFETNYDRPIPSLTHFAGKDIIIVDFSFKPTDMDVIRSLAKSVTWIDHHMTAKDYPYQDLPGLRNFEDKAMAGCELTWEYLFPNTNIPFGVMLVGDYDKWALRLPESMIFHDGLQTIKTDPDALVWKDIFEGAYKFVTDRGHVARSYKQLYCNDLCQSFGYVAELESYVIYACNQYMFGSQGFGEKMGQYPICAAYIHNGERFIVSLYSEFIDVGIIAKRYGGGGHKGAAGFQCNSLPWIKVAAQVG